MKIAIDISSVVYGTGVSVYTLNLLKNLLQLDKKNKYILFAGSLRRLKDIKAILSLYRNHDNSEHTEKLFPIPPMLADLMWNRLHILPIERLIGNIDVFHSSDWTQPPSKAFKVTTIHDLSPVLFPKLIHPKIVAVHTQRLKWVISEADRIIVPSLTTANDVIKMGFENKNIRIIPEAPGTDYKVPNVREILNVKNKYSINAKYLLAVGVNERKNTPRIIEAFEKITKQLEVKLVVVGHAQEKVKPVEGVIFTGHVPQNEMHALYSGAEMLVYPSLYEGFGIPILEAYRSRIPVVTSNLGSMKEIGLGSAVLVDPESVESIVEGVLNAHKNKSDLVKEGEIKVRQYSWEKTAISTLKVYREAK
jgi:glycosyltransferase involved in cell wall biosynthesis